MSRHQVGRGFRGALVLVLILAGCAPSPPPPKLDTGRLGPVELRRPGRPPRGLVFLFSSAGGWGALENAVAASLADRGAIVVGVDLVLYRKALDATDGECLYLLSEIEALSQQVQRELGVEHYFSPVLAGTGEGGMLVVAALAQSPAATVAGAIAVDPVSTLRTRLPLCSGAKWQKQSDGFRYTLTAALPGFLTLGFSTSADVDGRAQMLSEAKTAGDAIRIARDDRQAGAASSSTSGELLVELTGRYLVPERDAAEVQDRGWLIELPETRPGAPLVIVLSGDGGWRDIDKTVADALHDRGLNVIGLDSLRYFWHEKSPDDIAADLDRLIRHYTNGWKAPAVALVGYSFGADVLPFAYNRLPVESRDLVRQISLLGFSDSADFEFHVSGWLGVGDSAAALPTAPEATRIPHELLQCFYGEEDDESACPKLGPSGAELIRTSGGHHFDGDYEALAGRIVAGLVKRGVRAPEPAPAEPASE